MEEVSKVTIQLALVFLYRQHVVSPGFHKRSEIREGNEKIVYETELGFNTLRAEIQASNEQVRAEIRDGNENLLAALLGIKADIRSGNESLLTVLQEIRDSFH